jgi:hypothetical protein
MAKKQTDSKIMIKKKVTYDVAIKDFKRFTDKLEMHPAKLEKLEEEQEYLLPYVEYGNIVIDEDGNLEFHLTNPPMDEDGNPVFEGSIKFPKRRISVGEQERQMKGKDDYEKGRKLLSWMIGENPLHVKTIDSDDYAIINNIAAFFLPK